MNWQEWLENEMLIKQFPSLVKYIERSIENKISFKTIFLIRHHLSRQMEIWG